MQSQLLERKLSSSAVVRRWKTMVVPRATKPKTLIRSVRKLSERSSNWSTERNVASDRSRSSGLRSDMVMGAPKLPQSDWQITANPFEERPTQNWYYTKDSAAHTPYRQQHGMDWDNDPKDDSDDSTNQIVATITDLPRRLHTLQARTKLLLT